MIGTTRQRLTTLLLLLFVGVAGAIGYAVSNDQRSGNANPAAEQPPSGTGTVVGASPSASPRAPGGGQGGGQGGPSGVFSISGDAGSLVLGQPATLPLTITNPNPWPIQILTIDAAAGTPNGSPCPAAAFSVGSYRFRTGDAAVSAPARGTVRLDLTVELRDSLTQDQTGCRGATFPLTYTGTAVKTTR